MSADKDRVIETGECEFRDAAWWFGTNLNPDDEVFVKINVEGAEVDIIERLSERVNSARFGIYLCTLMYGRSPHSATESLLRVRNWKMPRSNTS